MKNSMMMAERHDDSDAGPAVRHGYAMPGDRLKLLLMDDNSFDRRAISRLSEKSRFNLKLVEATSISDARARLAEERPDMIFLDYRVPDGDGIEFSTQIMADMGGSAPPVVIITGEGDERTAIRSLRSGAADYLSKDGLSLDAFDGSIERCLAARPSNPADLMNELDRVNRRLDALREATRRNMHVARAAMLPMAEYAWRSVAALEGEERRTGAQRLMKVTERLSGILDDTLIHAVGATGDGECASIDVHAVVSDLLAQAPELADVVKLGAPGAFPAISANRPQIAMLFGELLAEALAAIPAGRQPVVLVHFASDPRGNPVVCVTDNGGSLADRRQNLAEFAEAVGDNRPSLPGRASRMSICQRLAEMNGGQLRLTDGRDGGCVAMIRFPKSPTKVH